jgi:uncharacterized protein YycO
LNNAAVTYSNINCYPEAAYELRAFFGLRYNSFLVRYNIYSRKDLLDRNYQLKAGNFIVTHGTGFIDRIIRLTTLSRWNHAALVVDGNGTLIELEAQGIRAVDISKYPADEFQIIDIEMSDEDRQQVVDYANFMLSKHSKYGFLTILTIALKIITRSRLVVKLDGTLICSEFVAKALAEGGVIWEKDTSLITPKDLWEKFVCPTNQKP